MSLNLTHCSIRLPSARDVISPIVERPNSKLRSLDLLVQRSPVMNTQVRDGLEAEFWNACQNLVHLSELAILTEHRMHADDATFVARYISHAPPNLEILRLVYRSIDVPLTCVAKALSSSKSINSITLLPNRAQNPEILIENCTSFHDTMKHNFTLTSLRIRPHCVLTGESLQHQECINFYLKLNNLGRGRLLAPRQEDLAPPDDWVNAIANQRDLPVVYYFLLEKPGLCCLPESRVPERASLPA